MSRSLHAPDMEKAYAEAEIDIVWRKLFSLLPTLIVKAAYDIPGLNTLSIDPSVIIRGLIVANRATEITVVTVRDVPANDSVTVQNIVKAEGDFIYLSWVESWDAETENIMQFEEFIDKNVTVASEADINLAKITTADESPREMFVSFLTKPIKNHIHIRFTNSDSSQRWAKHIWQGIKILKKDYVKYIWAHLKKILDSYEEVEEIVL